MLGSFGHFDALDAVKGEHVEFGAESGLGDIDRNGAVEVVFTPLKDGMFLDLEYDEEVARGASVGSGLTFVGEAEAGAIVDAGGDGDAELAVDPLEAITGALGAGFANQLAAAAAGAAGLADGEKALLEQDFAAAFAGGALGEAVVGIGAGAFAQDALFGAGHLDFGAHTANGVFEGDFEVVAEVFALAGAGSAAAAPAAAAEQVAKAEEVSENVAEVAKGFRIEAGRSAGGAADALVAVAVVGRALLRIGEYTVGFGGLFELLFGSLVVGVPVGVILQGELAVGGLQRRFVGAFAQAQDLTATLTIAGRRLRPLKL
jgi:hypothetical protein